MKWEREGDFAAVTVPADALAKALDRHPRFKVLRLADGIRRRVFRQRSPSELTIAVVDVETTGLDPTRDEVIELGVQCVFASKSSWRWQSSTRGPCPRCRAMIRAAVSTAFLSLLINFFPPARQGREEV